MRVARGEEARGNAWAEAVDLNDEPKPLHYVDLAMADVEPGEPNVGPEERTVWLRWTAPGSGSLSITTAESDFYMFAYTGSGLENLMLARDGGLFVGESFNLAVEEGQTYYLQVKNYDLYSSGRGELSWTLQ
jgi:hypothetical protein